MSFNQALWEVSSQPPITLSPCPCVLGERSLSFRIDLISSWSVFSIEVYTLRFVFGFAWQKEMLSVGLKFLDESWVCDCGYHINRQIVLRSDVQALWSRCSVPVVTNTVDRGSCFSKQVQKWENQSLLNYSRVQKHLIISVLCLLRSVCEFCCSEACWSTIT